MLQLSIFLLGSSQIIQIGRERKMGDGVEVYTRKCVSYWVADSFGVTESVVYWEMKSRWRICRGE